MTTRTVLYSGCFLEGAHYQGGTYYDRVARFLKFYNSQKMKSRLGHELIVLCDNASSPEDLKRLADEIPRTSVVDADAFFRSPHEITSDVLVLSYRKRLTRTGLVANYDYPFCWRILYTMERLTLVFKDVEKLISIDSDGFVLSDRLCDRIRNYSDKGWWSILCPRWNFPDTAFHVITREAFPILKRLVLEKDFMARNGECMEHVLPFTHVYYELVADRFGETRDPQPPNCDFYGQAPSNLPLYFNGDPSEPA